MRWWWWGPFFFLTNTLSWMFYSAETRRHVVPLGHIILIPSQPVFAFFPWCCVPSGEARHTNLIVLGLTQPRPKPTSYHSRGEHANHYATDAVFLILRFPYSVLSTIVCFRVILRMDIAFSAFISKRTVYDHPSGIVRTFVK